MLSCARWGFGGENIAPELIQEGQPYTDSAVRSELKGQQLFRPRLGCHLNSPVLLSCTQSEIAREQHRKKTRQSAVLCTREEQRVMERWILLKLQTTDLGLLSSPEDLFLTLTSSQCQLGSAQPHQEPVWGHFGKDMAAFTQKWEPQIHVFCSADLPLSVFTSRYCMCSILQGMLGKIYYANVYSVACFALPLLLVAFKEKKKVLLFLWSESFKKENADCMLLVSSFLWICFMGFRCTKMNCITITFLQ